MTTENSTPVSTPQAETVPAEELIQTDDFLNEIMGNMAKGTHDPVQKIESNNRMEAVENQNKDVEQVRAEVQEVVPQQEITPILPEVPEGNPIETPEEQPETIDKRLKDSQAMIGRQSNEIGQLRKQLTEVQNTIAEPQKQESKDVPYYEKLVNASDDQVAELLMKEAVNKNEDLEPSMARQQARLLKTTAQMQMDIANDKLKEITKVSEKIAKQENIAKQDKQWYAAHPEYKNRKQIIDQYISAAYPEGVEIKNEFGEVTGMKTNPYDLAHAAYTHAGIVLASTGKNVEEQNNQRIAAGRSANASTRGTVPSQVVPTQPPKDALIAETDSVFERSVAPGLSRSR